jgi:hypothetical protein
VYRDADDDLDLAEERRKTRERRKRVRTTALILGFVAVACGGLIYGGISVLKSRKQKEAERELATNPPPPPAVTPKPLPKPENNRTIGGNTEEDHFQPLPPVPKTQPTVLTQPPTPAPPAPSIKPPEPPPFVSDRPKKEVIPGYYARTVSGFTLYVSRLAYEESDTEKGKPLALVDAELARIADLFPGNVVKAYRTIAVWVEWDHTIPQSARSFAVYYGRTGERLMAQGVDPRKAGCVCLLSLKTAVRLAAAGAKQNTLIHEFAHVAHDRQFGFDNTVIRNAYQQAAARGLYARVKHDGGRVGPAYAGRNDAEYFAELTCAYFDRLDYYPHDRTELRDHDSVGYELMTKMWGTPEQIEAAKKKGKK